MADKTTINGVDVSGCEFSHHKDGFCRGRWSKHEYGAIVFEKCEENRNCHFKQLQRISASNKTVNKYSDALDTEYKILALDVHHLHKQSARKDERIRKLENQFSCHACGACKGKEDYRNLEKHHVGLRKEFDKQNDKLSQIAELVNKEISNLYCYDCDDREYLFTFLQQIKQIAQGE